jgi:hypothetical protein
MASLSGKGKILNFASLWESIGVFQLQAHYYVLSKLLPCSRQTLLNQSVHNLFGHQSCALTQEYRYLLEEDLLLSLSPHNLYQNAHFALGQFPYLC